MRKSYSSRNMAFNILQNEHLVAKNGFDTAENEHPKVRCTGFTRSDDNDWIPHSLVLPENDNESLALP